jgi:transcriptional regulator with XRE-family HTH domain
MARDSGRSDDERLVLARIKAWARVRGMNLRDLSTATTIPYDSLQAYLSGKRALPAQPVAAICRALNVSADLILFGGPKLDQASLIAAISTYERQRTDVYGELSRVTLAHHLEALYAEQLYQLLFHDKLRRGGEVEDEFGLWEWKQPGPLGQKP